MKQPKININRDKVSSEEIQQNMNFDSLYQKQLALSKPVYMKSWFWASTTAVAGLALVIVYFTYFNSNGVNAVMADYVSPPIDSLAKPYSRTTVHLDSTVNLEFGNGTIINIPTGSIIDANGKPYSGEAEVLYREFRDPVDILLSGIPMTYDSGGVSHQFESAGMFDIQLQANGTPLFLADGAQINIGLLSEVNSTRFNLYELDTTNRNWRLAGKDSVTPQQTFVPQPVVASTQPVEKPKLSVADQQRQQQLFFLLNSINDSIDMLQNTKLLEPKPSSSEGSRFTIAVRNMPEIILPDEVVFEVDPLTTGFQRIYTSRRWDTTSVTRVRGRKYTLNLEKDGEILMFPCTPVYHGQHYSTAVKYYNREVALMDTLLANLAIRKEKTTAAYNSLQAEASKKPNNNFKKQEQQMQNQVNLASTSNMFYRFASITNLGIWNIDCIYKRPNYVKTESSFKTKDGEPVVLQRLYVIEVDVNGTGSYYKMPTGPTVRFMFDPGKTFKGLGITEDGRIAIIQPDAFKGLDVTKGTINQLTVSDPQKPGSEDKIRKLLGIGQSS